jgi:hypothetical protein
MNVGLRLHGKVIGIDPGDPHAAVYANRAAVRGWEVAELAPNGDGKWNVRFLATNRQLSQQPDGSLQSRPAGAIGGYESFYATDQPDGSSLLYRFEGPVLLPALTIEAAS